MNKKSKCKTSHPRVKGENKCRICGYVYGAQERKEMNDERCTLCYEDAVFSSNTAVGERAFCSEKCYCEYMALPYKGKGYYGMDVE